MTALFSPEDMGLANDVFDARCGHGALAAALGIRVMDVMQYFEDGGYVNIPMMLAAIRKAGKGYAKLRGGFIPLNGAGVGLIQWEGPWCVPGAHFSLACAHRHWIAVREGLVWDSNFQDWIRWETWNHSAVTLYCPKTTGHTLGGVWLITDK